MSKVSKAYPKTSWQKVLSGSSDWETTEEILDVIHWLRMSLSLVCGLIFGVTPLVGMTFLLSYIALNMLGTFLFYNSYLRVDAEQFGGHAILLTEAAMPSLACFLMLWITTYSALHF
mmetsp:Transcript_36196/g.61032  ORF Transcript_36196/g.61032 Transcript_36196/m.61032 type:complete len:117 (+) Transcript_36196:96-446(+)